MMRRVTTVAEAIRILEKRKKERERFEIDDFFLPNSRSHAQLSRASQMIESNRTSLVRSFFFLVDQLSIHHFMSFSNRF